MNNQLEDALEGILPFLILITGQMTVLNQCSVLWLSRRSLPALQPDEAELSLGMADRVWEAALTTNQGRVGAGFDL